MRKILVFNQVTLDGYFSDVNGDMSWAHKQDPEWNEFVANNASGESELLFGRITYEQMAGFWPTPLALESFPEVAQQMNSLPKVVFSRTLETASWSSTRLVKGNLTAEVRKMKEAPGPDLVIMGSGSIVSQLAQEGLIDEFQLVVNPLVLGKGKTMFEGVEDRFSLQHTSTRSFGNGNVVLSYDAGSRGA